MTAEFDSANPAVIDRRYNQTFVPKYSGFAQVG
jgi:hypothetical protein